MRCDEVEEVQGRNRFRLQPRLANLTDLPLAEIGAHRGCRLTHARRGNRFFVFAGTGLARRRDVLGAGILENGRRRGVLPCSLRMHGDEDPSLTKTTFVAFSFELGDSHSDQRSGNPAYRGSDCGASEGGQNRTCRDKWSNTRDGECANADEPTEGTAQRATGAGASRGALKLDRGQIFDFDIWRSDSGTVGWLEERQDDRVGQLSKLKI